MSDHKNKVLSTILVAFGSLLGFMAVSYTIRIYQITSALNMSFYVYAFHIFWLTFIFDLHFKKRGVFVAARLNHKGMKMVWEALKARFDHVRHWHYFRHYQNYLVLPGLIYWTTVVLLFLNPFNHVLKQSLIVVSTFGLAVAYWFMKEHVSRKLEHDAKWIKVLSMVKLFAAFLSYAAILGITFRYGTGPWLLYMGVVTLTFLLVYQALFQHRLLNFNTFLWVVIIALAMGFVSFWVYTYWNTQYFSGGLVMLAIYNTLWGLLHHYLDRTLTKQIVFEYMIMTVFVISILFGSHNFNQRVL